MDMNKAFYLRNETVKPKWRVVDAQGKVLGRLATQIANMLRGKDRPVYTPHTMSQDYIIVLNAQEIKLTGHKLDNTTHDRYTGWQGGYKSETVREILNKSPERLIELAVKRMLPKNKSTNDFMRRLKIYTGSEHPHQGQVTK